MYKYIYIYIYVYIKFIYIYIYYTYIHEINSWLRVAGGDRGALAPKQPHPLLDPLCAVPAHVRCDSRKERCYVSRAAAKRAGNNLRAFKDFHLENGSSQSQNVVLTGALRSKSLDSVLESALYERGTPVCTAEIRSASFGSAHSSQADALGSRYIEGYLAHEK